MFWFSILFLQFLVASAMEHFSNYEALSVWSMRLFLARPSEVDGQFTVYVKDHTLKF